jgi:hypothetical protein
VAIEAKKMPRLTHKIFYTFQVIKVDHRKGLQRIGKKILPYGKINSTF